MWFPEPATMTPHGGSTAFLLQTWQEFFDSFTPDTYQPRLNHAASLVGELEEVAKLAAEDSRWEQHLAFLKDELKQISNEEMAFLERIPAYHWTISQLLKLTRPKEILRLAKVLKSRKQEYINHAFSNLHETALNLPRSKSAARSALQRVATIYLRSGRLPNDALDHATAANLQKAPSEIIDEILRSTVDKPATFRCILALRGEQSAVQHIARKVGFALLPNGSLESTQETKDFLAETQGAILIEINHTAAFASLAAKDVSRKLRHAIDLYHFYSNAASLEMIPKALIVDLTDGRVWTISPGAPAL